MGLITLIIIMVILLVTIILWPIYKIVKHKIEYGVFFHKYREETNIQFIDTNKYIDGKPIQIKQRYMVGTCKHCGYISVSDYF